MRARISIRMLFAVVAIVGATEWTTWITERPALAASSAPRATLHRAHPWVLPGQVDSNTPALWSLDAAHPTVMGLDVGSGTDKIAGATARFFMSGRSEYTITFTR